MEYISAKIMSITKTTKQSTFKGKKVIDDILKFSDESRINQEMKKNHQERPGLLPISCKSISPIECFQSLVNKHDKKDTENVYSMCLSFMLQTEHEVNIAGMSTRKVSTNYIFREKTKKKEAKSKAKIRAKFEATSKQKSEQKSKQKLKQKTKQTSEQNRSKNRSKN